MKDSEINASNSKVKNRLSREDLLEGKVGLEDREIPSDPRFRDPDAVLEQARLKMGIGKANEKKNDNTGVLKGHQQFVETGKTFQIQRPFEYWDEMAARGNEETSSFPSPADLKNEPNATNHRMDRSACDHDDEIARWKNYQKAVEDWKERVLAVVNRLQKDLLVARREAELLKRENRASASEQSAA